MATIKAKNQITLVDVTDAYSVTLTSESYTFVGNTSGAPVGSTCSTQVVVYQGGNQMQKVNVTVNCPPGIKADITGNIGSSPTITFTTTAVISSSCEATIAVKIDDTIINKKFSFAVAKQGNTGAKGDKGETGLQGTSVTKTVRYYKLQDSSAVAPSIPTSNPPSGWTTTEPTYTSGKSLYFVDITTFSNGSVSYSAVSKSSSYQAANDLKDQYDEIKMNYRFDENGQYIGKENSNAVVHTTNDKMEILVSGVAVTTVDTKGFVADQINIKSVNIGGYVLEITSDDCLRIT